MKTVVSTKKEANFHITHQAAFNFQEEKYLINMVVFYTKKRHG
jgi:hypothetical protein